MTIVEGVGWVLLHFVWQGAVIALALAIAAGGDRRTRRRGCATRSRAWR